jgi:DNA polymerase
MNRCEGCPFNDRPYVEPELEKNSDILFVGRDPGKDEVIDNCPFSKNGASGKELRPYVNILRNKGLKVSLTNVMKCRPPGNKAPTKDEYSHCLDSLEDDIKYTNPKLIVALGRPTYTALTGESRGLLGPKGLNGKIVYKYKIPIAVSVHPSYILHKRKDKKALHKGMLPVLHFFDREKPIKYKKVNTGAGVKKLLKKQKLYGMDIEYSDVNPKFGKIRCMAISDGKKTAFMEIEK